MPRLTGYVLSTAADEDLEEVFDYSLIHFGLDQAIKYLTDFDVVFIELVANPDLGRKHNEIKKGLRNFPKSSHVVFYRVMHDHIRIVRILHGSRDIPKFFD